MIATTPNTAALIEPRILPNSYAELPLHFSTRPSACVTSPNVTPHCGHFVPKAGAVAPKSCPHFIQWYCSTMVGTSGGWTDGVYTGGEYTGGVYTGGWTGGANTGAEKFWVGMLIGGGAVATSGRDKVATGSGAGLLAVGFAGMGVGDT